MCHDADATPCEPIDPIGPRTNEVPVWEPGIARFRVSGLRCKHCVTRIKNALTVSPHVLGADVHLAGGSVEVLFDAAELALGQVAAIITAAADGTPRRYTVRGASMAP